MERYKIDHELKIEPKYYNDVISGRKRFEVRKDDRNFKIGDVIKLEEFDEILLYTGRSSLYEVIFKFDGGKYGVEKGYCILSIKPYKTRTYLGITY
ncbi:DUF3850 domain-containing protein [Clostridium ihumii]|uniref:DUF3850 domain-containing protein n=1 Tax=Clostridium ihumii TaxID=1470356 RepID=UPI0006887ADD|nr:DUF3850 domain-containing protein [Clostridium ihumii]